MGTIRLDVSLESLKIIDGAKIMACSNKPQKICSLCNQEMTCDIQQGKSTCWCFDLPNVMQVEGASGGCLCRECLEAAIEKQNNQFQSQAKQLTQYR